MEIPVRHMAVTGQTQESGKTTTLTALISRAKLPAIAFLTKRGEASLHGRQILPFFQERADWPFVQSILESTMRERMKFERAWIVRACKGAATLADVQRNVACLQEKEKRALSQDVYMLLGEYLQRVVPLIATLPKTSRVDIGEGLAVMDLVRYPLELQMLVISSTLDWIHKHAEGVITIMPEAWKFVPQGRKTPVQVSAELIYREGAGLRNYLWVDSQDLAAVDKPILRACAVWLIGNQREANEIKRALANMPAGMKKPNAGDVATLELGQFFACYGREIRKTYVQPAWMSGDVACGIATVRMKVSDAIDKYAQLRKEDDDVEWKQKYDEEKTHRERLEQEVLQLRERLRILEKSSPKPPVPDSVQTAAPEPVSLDGAGASREDIYRAVQQIAQESMYQYVRDRLLKEAPQALSIAKVTPEIEVTAQRQKIHLDTSTAEGRVAMLIADGFFDVIRINAEVVKELAERGFPTRAPNVAKAFFSLTEKGFLVSKEKGRYRAVPGMKVNIVEAA